MRTVSAIHVLVMATVCTLLNNPFGYAETYSKDVRIYGAIDTTKVSGFRGASFPLQAPEKDHAIFGIASWERQDHPCNILIRTENINDSVDDSGGKKKDLCGKPVTSKPISVEYADTGILEDRIFISGVRVCMNPTETRVKGIQLRGKKITDDGKVVALPIDEKPQGDVDWVGYPIGRAAQEPTPSSTEPRHIRNNCTEWKKWVQCSRPDQVATGAIVHFEAGTLPRSLTGLALQCQQIGAIRTGN